VTEAIGDANQLYLLLLDELEHNLGDPAMQTTTTAALGFPAERAAALTYHLRHCLRPTLIYVNRTADADRVVRRIEDEPRAGAGDCVRLDGQTPLSHIQEAIERIERDDPADPVDQLVATRVVSHGVDIARLNMALFAGWPPSTAEYLQASSRSGRVYVGLVVISLDYIKRYEHTIFSHFRDYQAFLDRLVEAVPINRFAPNVLPRTLPGAFQALVLHWARRQPWGTKINTFAQPLYRALNAEPAAREQLIQALTAAFQFEQAQRLNVFHQDQVEEARRETERRARRLVNLFYRLEARFEKDSIATVLARRYEYAPMRSFRDIEGMIEVKPASSDYAQLLDALS
jgi:superfamily II DNA or RNA helicase